MRWSSKYWRIFLGYWMLGASVVCHVQLVYPIVGAYKGKSTRGMAIWGDTACLFNNGGNCRLLNLKTGSVVGEFQLACAGKSTHVNAACFGSGKEE